MKNKFNRYTVLFSLLLSSALTAYSQQSLWNSKLDAMRVFIENKGQFSKDVTTDENQLFGYIGSNEKFYFSKSGVTIKIDRIKKKKTPASILGKIFGSKEENEESEEYKTESYYLYARWENKSPEMTIEPLEKSEGYFTFGQEKYTANGYKKLLYKNIYPGIDVEYFIPGDSSGIEYNLIVHPGADISQVKLTYSGDVKKMSLKPNGNIVIETPACPVTEHAPTSWYAGEKNIIRSGFSLQKNTLSFELPDGINANKTIIIDPWVAGIAIAGNDIGYNVDYDDSLNLYVYVRAGNSNIYVCKYSPVGTLLWTHTVTSSTMYEGDFLVNKFTFQTYIGEGFNGGGAYIYRLGPNGTADGWVSNINSGYVEIWEMCFVRNGSSLMAIGGGTQTNLTGGIVDLGSGSINLTNFSGFNGICQDVVCGVIDNFGKLFVVYAQTICGVAGQVDNKIEMVKDSLNGPVWLVPSGYNAFLESSNHVPPAGAQSCNGFNALGVNDHFLFYYDGGGLAAYRKSNGAMLGSTSVGLSGTLYTTLNQGGIAADDCDNVYVGGPDNQVKYFSFNGTAFTYVDTIPLGWSGTGVSVRDIKYKKENKLLYVSGLNNVGVYDVPLSCATQVNENVFSEAGNIQVFPNPASDYTIVKWNKSGKYKIEILDITGKSVQVYENVNSGELNVNTEKLDRGIYTIKLTDGQNQVLGATKLVVE
jgi:hypothetical protein